MTPRIVVAGGGPAGLAAATAAARAGASVLLLEERSKPGGRLLYRVQPVASESGGPSETPDQIVTCLVDAATAAGVEIRTGALVAGCFAGNELLVVEDGRASRVTPDAIVVTTGSSDLPYPFAGASFPGVFSARGLRILINQHRVRPGRRYAIIGRGEDAEELAVDILLAGGEVVWSGIAPAPFLRADGADGVQGLSVGQDRHDVDIVAIALGRQADAALAAMASVPLAISAELGGFIPMVDDRLQSPVPGIFVAGDAAGAGGVTAAIAEGHLAGVAAVASLGLANDEDVTAVRILGGPELAGRIAVRATLPAVAVQPYA